MRRHTSPALVGFFVVVGVALAVTGIVLFGSGKLFQEELTLVSFFPTDVAGLRPGSPVSFRGVEVGQVVEVRITLQEDPQDPDAEALIPVIYEIQLDRIDALVDDDEPNIDEPGVLDDLIDRGLRAELATQSLLTGTKSILLTYAPDAPDTRVAGADLPHPEVPIATAGSFLDLQNDIQGLIYRVSQLPVDSLLRNLDGLVTEARSLIRDPEIADALSGALRDFSRTATAAADLIEGVEESAPSAVASVEATFLQTQETLKSIDATLDAIQSQTDPESPFSYRTEQVLKETESALRSFRTLVDYLRANPNALLRGRGGGQEDR